MVGLRWWCDGSGLSLDLGLTLSTGTVHSQQSTLSLERGYYEGSNDGFEWVVVAYLQLVSTGVKGER